jgi:hypothetical protein
MRDGLKFLRKESFSTFPSQTWLIVASCSLQIQYKSKNWTDNGDVPNQVSFQNLILAPSPTTHLYPKRTDLTAHINPLKKSRSICFSAIKDTPGLDGVSFNFYQKIWEVVKSDIMELFQDFFEGKLDIYRLNFVVLSLIPKEPDATSMKKIRPISLLNCIFKIFTKVLTNRLGTVMDFLIAPNQTAFIKGRYILESVVTAHEVLHSVVQSGEKGAVFKLDYEKAFDRVNLDFLDQLLLQRGFGPKMSSWIHLATRGGSVAVKLNGVEGDFFTTSRGLRQGAPCLRSFLTVLLMFLEGCSLRLRLVALLKVFVPIWYRGVLLAYNTPTTPSSL